MENERELPGKAGIILIGLLEAGIALLCLLIAALMGLMPYINPAAIPHQGAWAALVVYLVISAILMFMAVGTMLGRRWARVLMLILSWFWLICGVLGTINSIVMFHEMEETMLAGGNTSPQAVQIARVVMSLVLVVFFVLLPGIFVLFYGRKKAKENFKAWDPKESWAEKCPAPVLFISLCSGLGAVFLFPLLAVYHFVTPFFGTLLVGWPGGLVCLLMAGLMAYISWGSYHLKMAAWWSQFGFMLFWGLSSVLTFARHSMLEMQEKMGFPDAELQRLKTMGYLNDTNYWAVYTGSIVGIYLLYMLFIRKYFSNAEQR